MGNGISKAQKINIFWGSMQTPLAHRAFGAPFPCASWAYQEGKPRYAPVKYITQTAVKNILKTSIL